MGVYAELSSIPSKKKLEKRGEEWLGNGEKEGIGAYYRILRFKLKNKWKQQKRHTNKKRENEAA